MSNMQLTNKLSEEILLVIKQYGTPAVKLLLGIYGLYIINNLAEKAIDTESTFSAGFLGLGLSINNETIIQS